MKTVMHLLLHKSSLSDSSSRCHYIPSSDLEGPAFIFLFSYHLTVMLLNYDAVAPPTVLINERLCIFINVTGNKITIVVI